MKTNIMVHTLFSEASPLIMLGCQAISKSINVSEHLVSIALFTLLQASKNAVNG